MKTRWYAVLILGLLAVPGAVAHGGNGDGHEDPGPQPPPPVRPRDPWWSEWNNFSWYGSIVPIATSPTPIRHLRAGGDYLVWETTGDILGLHTVSGTSFNVTRDAVAQGNPATDGRTVVYEQRAGTTWDIYAYDLETGITRRLTASDGNEKEPVVRGTWVAWLDDRNGRYDVYATNLANGTEIAVSVSNARKSDLVLLGDGVVAWREIEYNQWDIAVRRLPDGSVKHLTRDRTLEHPPQTDGKTLSWVKALPGTSDNALYRWDPTTGDITLVGRKGVSTNPVAFLDNGLEIVYSSSGPSTVTYLAINRSSDRYSVIGPEIPGAQPAASGNRIFVPVRTATEFVVLSTRVSPYAVEPMPKIKFGRPLDGGVLTGATLAAGTYQHAESWPTPSRFEYRLTQTGVPSTWLPFSSGDNWTFILDPSKYDVGRGLRLYVRAIYDGAPPAEAAVTINYRLPRNLPVSLTGEADTSVATLATKNPGIVLFAALAVVLLVLLVVRWNLSRHTRREFRVEYVRPEEDG